MKASQLRQASQLIDTLDKIDTDLKVLAGKTDPNVAVRLPKGTLVYKPLTIQYIDFLKERRHKVIGLLGGMGVDVTT